MRDRKWRRRYQVPTYLESVLVGHSQIRTRGEVPYFNVSLASSKIIYSNVTTRTLVYLRYLPIFTENTLPWPSTLTDLSHPHRLHAEMLHYGSNIMLWIFLFSVSPNLSCYNLVHAESISDRRLGNTLPNRCLRCKCNFICSRQKPRCIWTCCCEGEATWLKEFTKLRKYSGTVEWTEISYQSLALNIIAMSYWSGHATVKSAP